MGILFFLPTAISYPLKRDDNVVKSPVELRHWLSGAEGTGPLGFRVSEFEEFGA